MPRFFPVFLSTLLALLLLPCGLLAQNTGNQAVILQYHHISSTTPRITSVTVEEFKQHMDYLRDNGFTVLPLPQILQALKQNQPLPDKTAAITFDDAYISVYKVAFPLLQQMHWPFTVFVPSGLIGTNPGLYTSWEQLREMGAAGATLANHSVSHPYLLQHKPQENEDDWLRRVEHEITDSEQKILQETGQSHKIHAYPYGEYNPQIQAMLTRLGYMGLGQQSGPINANSDFTALPRFPFSGIYTPIRTFAPKVNSLAFNVRIRQPASPVTSENAPGAELEFDGTYRLKELACYVNDQRMKLTREDTAKPVIRLESPVMNKARRFHYTCTAPGSNGRYYWFSVPFVNPALPDY